MDEGTGNVSEVRRAFLLQSYTLTLARIGHFGGILADEMGMGKTVQMLATMTVSPPPSSKPKGTLIVCPVGLLDQWKSEVPSYFNSTDTPNPLLD